MAEPGQRRNHNGFCPGPLPRTCHRDERHIVVGADKRVEKTEGCCGARKGEKLVGHGAHVVWRRLMIAKAGGKGKRG